MSRCLSQLLDEYEQLLPNKSMPVTKEEFDLLTTTYRPENATCNIAEVLAERGSRYGPFSEHARITQAIKYDMRCSAMWESLTDSQREALEMIAHKIGRILNGDPNYLDSWVDIVGYTQLVIDELNAANANQKEKQNG